MNSSYRLLNLIATLAVIIVNALANVLPINDYTTGDLSALYPNLFVPAGFTFSIWSLIYLGLLGFCGYQWLPSLKGERRPVVEALGAWYLLSCILNIAWIFAWHYLQMILSVVIMLALLACLIKIYRQLRIRGLAASKYQRWLVHAPFSLYLGWISIATVANITTLLVFFGWDGYHIAPGFWAASMIFMTALLGLFMLYRANDWIYGVVLLWAFAGIVIKRWLYDPQPYPVILTACAFAGLLLLNGIYRVLRQKDSHL